MNRYEKIARIKQFTDHIGTVYGTEDFAIYLYSLIKMTRPNTVLELGTGFGSAALWVALGLEENQLGVVHTIDDGSEWAKLKQARELLGELDSPQYEVYIRRVFEYFELDNYISFYHQKISKIGYLNNIDMIFCDYSHGPYSITKLIADYFTKMNESSFIFVDSASTYFSSFLTLETLIQYLNQQRIPKTLYELIDSADLIEFEKKLSRTKFELTHVIENKTRNQNSTAQIKIIPLDIMPQPRINVRF